mmetsp:Transcript_45805/g.143563  ORF Transcript_45805/g.143563 Transcript_45805/m.143563 type:complete len:340 (-) Transcript_45805:104-1123(-)
MCRPGGGALAALHGLLLLATASAVRLDAQHGRLPPPVYVEPGWQVRVSDQGLVVEPADLDSLPAAVWGTGLLPRTNSTTTITATPAPAQAATTRTAATSSTTTSTASTTTQRTTTTTTTTRATTTATTTMTESTTESTTSSTVRCSGANDCASCTMLPECGWCALERRCEVGDKHGPRTTQCAVYDFSQCTHVPCAVRASCPACAADPECVWCGSTAACVDGTSLGPLDNTRCPDPPALAEGAPPGVWVHRSSSQSCTGPMSSQQQLPSQLPPQLPQQQQQQQQLPEQQHPPEQQSIQQQKPQELQEEDSVWGALRGLKAQSDARAAQARAAVAARPVR